MMVVIAPSASGEELAHGTERHAFELPPPVAKRLERKPLSLTILSLIQIALAPRLMVRAPKGLTVTLARALSVRHLFLLTCKVLSKDSTHLQKRPVRTDRVRQAQNKRANNGRLPNPVSVQRSHLVSA